MRKRFVNFLSRKQGTILVTLLGLIGVLFIGILVTAYLVARHANPVILDEHGKPMNSQSVRQR
ncbi:MAG TPA: hypothetical protein PKC13_13460 [Blastocatellia bacterium]|nr:hypothetical protein [Blastocatellia bacterium]HMV84373.1 hypothetical protein [Blastocatellia bacterium]HMX26605.1 hypothetical protein [Blastocatellia bacterium]HMY76886.1 hypothetical protein [Blastocatellia bacterium]HNG31052.1 hypothetical protein [Blastocatellia bacterium]